MLRISRWLLLGVCLAAGLGVQGTWADEAALRVSGALGEHDWPWWRGPSRQGWAASQRVPTHFSDSQNVLWKAPVPGRGHSSAIVVQDSVFLTTADEALQEQSVLAYDLGTGKQRWQQAISHGGFPANNHRKNSEATPTIASDGQRLFITFYHHERIELTVLDLQGAELWRQEVGPFNPKMYEFGYAPSPVLYANSVIVVAEQDGQPEVAGDSYIAAFERASGRPLWRTQRAKSISFSTPVVAQVAGREQLLLSGQDKVSSYDPSTGQLLWEAEGTTAATCGTIVWDEQLVFASGGFPKAETLGVRADGSGAVVWRNNQKMYEQSLILVDGYLYALTDKGVLYCWRASDGREMWRERLSGPVSASAVYVGGYVYWANEAGTYYVFRPNAEKFQLVAENRVGEEAFASPAIAGNRLLLRTAHGKGPDRQEFLYCIGE